jgi:hypothetical protein
MLRVEPDVAQPEPHSCCSGAIVTLPSRTSTHALTSSALVACSVAPDRSANQILHPAQAVIAGSRIVRQMCDPAAGGLEQCFVGDVVEGAQLQEVLRDRQAEDAAHGDQGAEVRVVAVQ